MIVCFKLNPAFSHDHVFPFFFFFFFFLRMNSNLTWFTMQETKITIHALFITVYNTVYVLKNIKMGPTVLFTHLKIILL